MSKRPYGPSRRVDAIPQAMSIYINQLVYQLRRQGRAITSLSLGEAFFELPQLDWEGIDTEAGYHYSDSQGLPELREQISRYYRRQYQADVGPDDLLISCGSKPLIYLCMLATAEPGDEVLIHEPGWLSYVEQARLAGLETRYLPYDLPLAEVGRHFSDRTRLLIINNPNNPAGRLYSKAELHCLYQQCRAHGIYLLVDEAYSDFVDEPFTSLWNLEEDRSGMLIVNSLSKNLGMSGWRLGYVIAPPELLTALLKLNQHLLTCAPTLLAQYVARRFDDLVAHTRGQIGALVAKRRRLRQALVDLGLDAMAGDATFYFFVDVGAYPHGTLNLALDLLLNHGIAVVPGGAYGDSTAHFIRLSIGTESEEDILAALKVIKEKLRPDCPLADLDPQLRALGLPLWEDA
ncbi:pyridoxal phosphate-dependent aminotransferase [Gallaecimonas sp. GXIMD4217]|uniref:pyridoxal phosphate-dependent aminotransferase n=1 Tax=Gallaecimonas sp. GXIMD4217 TaxID=3131927 RepID=UPI00311AEBE3